MKKNIFATFAFAALAALGLPFAAQAVGTEGDIYSITPVDSDDQGRTFTPGQKIQFRVRLLASDWNSSLTPSDWVKTYEGSGDPTIAEAMFPPKLGLVIGGKLREAEIVREEFVKVSGDESGCVCTDLICSYKVVPGDLALPALMALAGSTENAPIAADKTKCEAGVSYFLANSNLWKYRDRSGNACQFFYAKAATAAAAYKQWNDETVPALPQAVADYDLTTANFLVKGIDFDETSETSQDGKVKAWRVVRENKETLKSSPAPIVTTGEPTVSKPDEAIKLYVWSENEDAVRMAGKIQTDAKKWVSGETMVVDFPTNRAGTLTVKRYVTLVETATGKTDYSLSFKGGEHGRGLTAKIVLSPILGYRYSTTGEIIDTAYLTREVYCDEPEKPNVQISFEKDSRDGGKTKKADTSMKAAAELGEDKIPVYITLSEAYTAPVPVQLVVRNATLGAPDPITNQNISVSQYEDFSTTDIAYTNLVIGAEGESSTEAIVYVYPLGGDVNTQNGGIDFSVVLTGAGKDYYAVGQSAKLFLDRSKHKPTVTVMQESVGPQEQTGFDVSLQVADCWRDMQRKFKVEVTYDAGSAMSTNVLFTEGVPVTIRLTGYGINATTASIKVTDSVGNICAENATVKFSVKPQKTITASLYDSTQDTSLHAGTKFDEGDPAYVRFTLSEKLSVGEEGNRYAFLEPQNAASSNLVACSAFTNGVLIAGGSTNSLLTAASRLTLLDGCPETDGTRSVLTYKIILRKGSTPDAELDKTFTDTQGLVFSVENLYPETKKVFVNGANKPVTSGTKWSQPVPCQVDVRFVYQATDASKVDTTNGLISVWCFTEGRAPRQSYQYVAVTSKTETATSYHKFTTPSVEQTVEVVTIDKDILAELAPDGLKDKKDLEELWPLLIDRKAPYSFTVDVESRPHIEVTLEGFTGDRLNRMDETGNEKQAKLRVALSEPAEEVVTIQLIAKSWATSDSGTLTFYKGKKIPASDPDYPNAPCVELRIPVGSMEAEPTDAYKDGYVSFVYDDLNGTSGSEDDGWELIARIKDDGTSYKDYYLQAEGKYIYVVNLAPTIKPRQPSENEPVVTNKTASIGKEFEILWTPGDVKSDLLRTWPGTANVGLKTEWFINDAAVAGSVKYITVGADGKTVEQQSTKLSLKEEGLSVIKLVITDFDGEDYHGVTERTWLYYIAPTKKLNATPVAPGSPATTRYKGKAGVGQGRVWTDGGAAVVAGFSQTWSYNVATKEGTAYAYGYAHADAPYSDDGTLGPAKRDLPIDPYGETWEAGDYFKYENVGYDNYFYRWVRVLPNDNGGSPTIEYDPINPTTSPLENRAATVVLDEYEAEKVSYATRRIEAVFAREWLPSDNLGDINADGVPDSYLTVYPDLGVSDADGNVSGDDLADIGRQNVDNDYLPSLLTERYAAFIPGAADGWATVGRAFTTLMELRGVGTGTEALNDATALKFPDNVANPGYIQGSKPERVYRDPGLDTTSTLALIEYIAFTNWCGRQETPLDPTVEANWKLWSPERPTNPTVEDTDNDGLPDGYEYYFWYKAHVGQFEVGTDKDGNAVTNYVRITGRRYNPYDPMHPTVISADEIEAIYDPIKPAGKDGFDFDRIDSDNDGLVDSLEFERGTNPFDYDTDRDGLPDGYEVLILDTDPLNARTDGASVNDANRNDDGDTMAVTDVAMIPVTCAFTNSVKGDVAASLAQTNTFWVMASDEAKLAELKAVEGGDFPPGVWTNLANGVDMYTAFGYRTVKGKEKCALGKLGVNAKSSTTLVIYEIGKKESVYALHYQVYGLKGFNPKTAWMKNGGGDDSAPYTAYDEFMSLAFFYQTGGLGAAQLVPSDARPWQTIWQELSTNPLNCDGDGDNVPDGWELYTMGGTKEGSFKQHRGFVVGPGALYGIPAIYQLSPLWDYHTVPPGFDENLTDADGDGLDHGAEWCGVECCAAYPTLTNVQPEWRNKKWPTDPWDKDTDGDGLADGQEKTWLYGTSGVDGGGLNPLSWDTDLDGLPDPWELEFAGTFNANAEGTSTTTSTNTSSSVASDGTTNTTTSVATNTTTGVQTAGYFNNDGMNPTVSDAMLDYDHDGLNNWQEYMVGAMRCWRYDDLTSPWFSHELTNDELALHAEDEDWWGHTLVERWNDFEKILTGYNDIAYNPGLRNGMFDPGTYFSCCNKTFDPAYGRFYMFKDGVYHDLRDDVVKEEAQKFNRWTWRLRTILMEELPNLEYTKGGAAVYPEKYISCDPRKHDTDNDGMDDHYELFHGLNPLLGTSGGYQENQPCDIVFMAWGGSAKFNPPSALSNRWIYDDPMRPGEKVLTGTFREQPTDVKVLDEKMSEMDFFQYPWLAGQPTADPDGDNIRNQQESILSKVQAARTYQHTDPTPLWMTDTSYDKSLTARYYQIDNPSWADNASSVILTGMPPGFSYKNYSNVGGEATYYYFNDFPWLSWKENPPNSGVGELTINYDMNRWNTVASMFDYEENEGYDSDHDYLSDFEESQAKTKSSSDPQQHDSPLRHQAMYFGGEEDKGWLQTPLMVEYAPATEEASSELRQAFLYYTVEAWVKPDASVIADSNKTYTAVERVIYTGKSGTADWSFLRKNFYIGIKNGRWYTKFDSTGTDLNQPVEITDGPLATTGWTHLAASYGPSDDNETGSEAKMELRLYVNGKTAKAWKKETAIQPEHGEAAAVVNDQGELISTVPWTGSKPLISILVGASAKNASGIMFAQAWETRTQKGAGESTTEYDYESFFKGYVDEVRVWDGARKADDIKSDYDNRVRYTSELATKNLTKVYEAFKEGALRSPANKASVAMPAELCYHWAFDHLPSAVEKGDVLQTPAGFTTDGMVTDAKAIWSRPSIDPTRENMRPSTLPAKPWTCTWWESCKCASSVYADRAWVPWINDTVSHLPFFDGTTADSVYWSEDYAGYQSAEEAGYTSFAFPRTAEVWSLQVQQLYSKGEDHTQTTRWTLPGLDVNKFRFARRNRYATGSDLLPLLGAYPKRIASTEGGMWDDEDACASDVWAQTGPGGNGGDPDNDGLPTWWEDLAWRYNPEVPDGIEDITWNTTVTYDGKRMSAGRAYLLDLVRGMLPDGEYHVEYADTRDTDKDGVIDHFAREYNLMDGHAGEDTDGDGLSNYAEYLITEVFKYAECDPENYATDGKTCDYFLKLGELYLGEIFTDHDQMDDVWESKYDTAYVNRGIYDPLEDRDGDGWSNYAEFRAGTDPSTKDAMSIDGYVCPEYPVPSVAANIVYNGRNPIRKPLVIKAWNEKNDYAMAKAPDAIWTLGKEDEASDSGTDTATEGLVTREKFIGRKPTGERTFYLSGGHIAEGSVKLFFLDKTFGIVTYDPVTQYVYPVEAGEPQDAKWYYHIIDKGGKLVRAGGTLYEAMGYEEVVVGTVDYLSGRITIDFSNEDICGQTLADPGTAESSDDDTERAENTYDYIDLDNSYVRIEWQASSAMAAGAGLHYLSDPDTVSDSSVSFGHLREGKNTFICFVDDDDDGQYTAGEPFGVVRGVDVGWAGAAFDIELSETSPIFARIKLEDGSNDRSVIYGVDSGNVTTNGTVAGATGGTTGGTDETSALSGGAIDHVRIVPYLMSSTRIDTSATQREFVECLSWLPNRVVAEFDVDTSTHPFISEADFIKDGAFDIDWDGFATDAFSLNNRVVADVGDITAVKYQIVLGKDGPVGRAFVGDTTTVYRAYSTLIERRFEPLDARTVPTALKLGGGGTIVYGARPTFMWRLDEPTGVNNLTASSAFFGCSYTAFQIQVMDTDSKVVYDSGVVRAPVRDADGYFTWTAPLTADGQTALNKVFSRTGNWKWHVAMYNAKFKPRSRDNGWSADMAFSTAVNAQQDTDDHGYGTVLAAVKYAGPTSVLANAEDLTSCKGIVRVQAFARPDFTGDPEAETFVTNATQIAMTTNLTANVKLRGLKAGTYYIRAYVDSDGNLKKDDWESWGYAKSAVTVVSARVPETATVWIEDADTDGDWLPDAWEYEKYGSLMHKNAMASVDASGKIILKTTTYDSIKKGFANISSTLPGASLTLFENLDAARLLLNLGTATTTDTIAAIRAAVAKAINPGSVRITQLLMNAPAKKVTMSVAANVTEPEPTASALLAAVYEVPDVSTVVVNVYSAEALDGEWTLVEQKTVQVNAGLDATFDIPLTTDLSSRFYKVEVVQ